MRALLILVVFVPTAGRAQTGPPPTDTREYYRDIGIFEVPINVRKATYFATQSASEFSREQTPLPIVEFVFCSKGRLTLERRWDMFGNPSGVYHYEYDEYGRQRRTEKRDSNGSLVTSSLTRYSDDRQETTWEQYDQGGSATRRTVSTITFAPGSSIRVREVLSCYSGTELAETRTTNYDDLGRAETVLLDSAESGVSVVSSYSYDDSNVTREEHHPLNRDSYSVVTKYDEENRPRLERVDSQGLPSRRVSWEYKGPYVIKVAQRFGADPTSEYTKRTVTDSSGRLLRQTEIGEDGASITTTSYHYEFDERMNWERVTAIRSTCSLSRPEGSGELEAETLTVRTRELIYVD